MFKREFQGSSWDETMTDKRSTITRVSMRISLLLGVAATALLLGGCGDKSKPKAAAPPPPEVKVAAVVQETVPIVMAFAGTVQSVQVVDIIPRVSGYLEERYFKEGTYIKKGDPLYLIDPRPYQASLDALQAQSKTDEASLKRWTSEAKRYTRLAKKGAGSVEDKEQAIARRDEIRAKLEKDQANIENAELNLSFTKITAPFDGRIENTKKYPGALVEQQRDVLTTLVQIDPIYVIFNISRRQAAVVQALQAKEQAPTNLQDFKAEVFLPDGTKYHRQGQVDYVSLQLDPKTDTLLVRAIFPNEGVDKQQTTLIPGQYVPIHLIAGHQPDALLIPQAALVQSQIGAHVFVVDKDNKVETRRVKVDRAYDKQWVIRDGLKKTERVIVDGIQKVRSGMVVKVSGAGSGGKKG
jgi:membrane fusion protein (multidrug efflux system)